MLAELKKFFRLNTMGMREPAEPGIGLITLPITMKPSRREFEELGFQFFKWRHEDLKNGRSMLDQVLCLAKLPDGWKEVRGINEENSYLVDEKGRRRVEVFERFQIWEEGGEMHLIENKV